MLQRFVRRQLNALRRAFGQTRWAGTFRRSRRARLSIPAARLPDPAFLPDSPQELALPPELRDARLLADAIAWSHGMGERHAAARPAPREVTRRGRCLRRADRPETCCSSAIATSPATARCTRTGLRWSSTPGAIRPSLRFRAIRKPLRTSDGLLSRSSGTETRTPTVFASRTAVVRTWSTRSLRANEFQARHSRSRDGAMPICRSPGGQRSSRSLSRGRAESRRPRAAPGAGAG